MAIKGNKKLVAGVIIGVLFAGVGTTYAAPNVDFANFKFKFDGVQKSVPDGYVTLQYQGRTYVPARFVAEQLGAKVDWDGSNQTVVITSGQTNSSSINTLKMYSQVAENYRIVQALGDLLHDSYTGLNLANDVFNSSNDNSQIQTQIDDFNNLVSAYNTTLNNLKTFQTQALQAGISNDDLTDFTGIMSGYSNAMDFFKAAISNLVDYSNNRSSLSESSFLSNVQTADKIRISAETITINDYNKFYNKIQNFGN